MDKSLLYQDLKYYQSFPWNTNPSADDQELFVLFMRPRVTVTVTERLCCHGVCALYECAERILDHVKIRDQIHHSISVQITNCSALVVLFG